jgi:regulator of replication initiation timing
MAVATDNKPIHLTDMSRSEAENVTKLIKENFDSLGAMLMNARDRKAYKVLGYRTFEIYCNTEFGKSISSAYQLIEDARVVAQLEAEISKQYTEPVTLNFPSSHLRQLKDIPEIGDKLKAIEYAQKLAIAEGKKPNKSHVEIAVFEISGKRSEDYRKAIQNLGFTKGTQVEVTKSLKQDRGFVTKTDKRGRIYVELYNGGAVPIICDNTSELRILNPTEKPAIPASDNTANKGDRVKIFAKGLEGKTGEIYTWKMGKHAIILIEGDEVPIAIAYAELEIIDTPKKDCNWESELVWNSGKSTYYYFPKEDKIYSNRWPTGLTLAPSTFYAQSCHTENPIEFIKKWEEKFAGEVLESFATHSRIKTLILAQATQLPEEEKREFVTDLIANLTQLLPHQDRKELEANKTQTKAVGISFSKTIDELVSGKKTQTRRSWQEDYAKNFIRYFEEGIEIPALSKGRHRGGHELGHIRLTQRPYQQYLSEMTPTDLQEEGGMVSTSQEFIDTFFDGKDQLVWVLHFEFETSVNTTDADKEILKLENQRLREQLTEAEFAIEAMVNMAHNLEFETSVNTADADGEVIETEDQTSILLGRLREQLIETESAFRAMVNTDSVADAEQTAELLVENADSTDSALATEQTAELLVENAASTASPLVTETSWLSVLESNDFSQNGIQLDEEPTETYRGWDIYVHNILVADISHPTKGIFSINLSGREKQILRLFEWLKNIINQVEDFCPDQPLELNPEIKTEVESFPQELTDRIAIERERLFDRIDKFTTRRGKTKREREINTKRGIEKLRQMLSELEIFEGLRIGQVVWDKNKATRSNLLITGEITGFNFTEGGMPHLFVKWNSENGISVTSAEIISRILINPPEL